MTWEQTRKSQRNTARAWTKLPCSLSYLWTFSVAQFSRSVMSNSFRPHGLQHARLPCPSLSPGVCSNSCPLNQWCHPTASSSVTPFSSCPQSFPASGSFPMSRLFASSSQSIRASLQHQFFQWIFRIDFLRIDWLDLLAVQGTLFFFFLNFILFLNLT